MKITLTSEESLRIEQTPDKVTIEATSHDQAYSAFHMLGSALGACTLSVLQSWAVNRNMRADDLIIEVSWSFVERQHRLGGMAVRLAWPSLPPELWPRAIRAANLCSIHQTLTHPVAISVDAVGVESPAIEGPADLEQRRAARQAAAIPQADVQPKAANAP